LRDDGCRGRPLTTSQLTHAGRALPVPPAHARFSRRIQALAVDVLVHGTALIALMSVLEVVREHREFIGAAVAGWLGFALLYEPVLVSRRGATLGHTLARLRVVDLETGGNPDPTRAFARFWLKATSGMIALLFMAVTRRPQALHDLAAGTYVGETGPIDHRRRDG
jgi:uncharacterized RDD family membrane protein YckC